MSDITFELIAEANKQIKTTPVKGKDYAEVNQRIKAFRMVCPDGGISTEILSHDGGLVVMKATVTDGTGRVLGTGTAFERQDASYINKTSYIENCETSAVGRALGMCGYGIDTAICSYEELSNAIQAQNAAPAQDAAPAQSADHGINEAHWNALKALAKKKGKSMKSIGESFGFSKASECTFTIWNQAMSTLDALPDKA